MTALVVLMYIPIITILLIIIGIIRLIARASGSKNNTYVPPPPPPPGQYPNQTNPYNQNNPYNQQQQPWQNTGGYQQPNYNQPNYNQPNYNQPDYTQTNYNQPNYNQPNYNQPNYTQSTWNEPGTTNTNIPGQKRSSPIPGTYATHVGAMPEKKRNPAVMIILITVGVFVLIAGLIAFVAYRSENGSAALTSGEFKLAYENPTDHTYYIILDDWDTIKVEPHTATEDLYYTFAQSLTQMHWVMTTEDGTVIADTMVNRNDLESWHYDRVAASSGYYGSSMILLNPSRSEFVYYSAWFAGIGVDYSDSVKIGDSIYFVDAWVTSAPFIFDAREADYETGIDEINSSYSTPDQQQFLVSAADFPVLLSRLGQHSPRFKKMEEFRRKLVELFEVSREEILANSAYDSDDVTTVYDLDSLTPLPVDQYTEPRDFIPAIEFVKENKSLFKATAFSEYKYVTDSADALLKHAYVEQDRPQNYPQLRYITYSVYKDGIFSDVPRREAVYDTERDENDGTHY